MKKGKTAVIRDALYTAMLFLATTPMALAFSFSSSTSSGGYGPTGNSGLQPGGGASLNTVVENADTTTLLVKGLVIDFCTLAGITLLAMGLYRISKDKERGENNHASGFKMILVGGALTSIGVFAMATVNAIYT